MTLQQSTLNLPQPPSSHRPSSRGESPTRCPNRTMGTTFEWPVAEVDDMRIELWAEPEQADEKLNVRLSFRKGALKDWDENNWLVFTNLGRIRKIVLVEENPDARPRYDYEFVRYFIFHIFTDSGSYELELRVWRVGPPDDFSPCDFARATLSALPSA